MRRYLLALIPGSLLFLGFYILSSGEPNLLFLDLGRISFIYIVLALAVTPIIAITKKTSFASYRRVFGVLAFLLSIGHAAIYFYDEKLYHHSYLILDHFKQLDVFSGTVAFIIIALLGLTSNNFSVRLLRTTWKKIQALAYPLFLIVILHVAFASHFNWFYMLVTSLLIFLRTYAYLQKDHTPPAPKILTGKVTRYLCVPCGYIYDEKYGDPDGGIAPGTRFEDIPDDWICPVCGVSKSDFVPYEETEAEDTPATVLAATLLNPTTLELLIKTEKPFTVIPGQYGRIALRDRDGTFYRSYSVVDSEGGNLRFCIKLSTGRGGNILRDIKVGDSVGVEGIRGTFLLQHTKNPKVFIATGTGLAPIVYMMRQIPDIDKMLLFGVQDTKNLFYTEIFKRIPKLETHIFLSREEIPGFHHGRIDSRKCSFQKESEFYICGNPAMVKDTISELRALGFEKIYHEQF